MMVEVGLDIHVSFGHNEEFDTLCMNGIVVLGESLLVGLMIMDGANRRNEICYFSEAGSAAGVTSHVRGRTIFAWSEGGGLLFLRCRRKLLYA